MKKLLLPLLGLILFPAIMVSAITQTSHPNGTTNISFNQYTDSIPLSYLSGNCPDYGTVCNRATGNPNCQIRQYRNALTNSEAASCLNANNTNERNFVRARKLNGPTTPYSTGISSPLSAGDTIRVLVYAHNSGEECNNNDSSCLNRTTAKNTTISLNWGTAGSLRGSVYATNASPNTTTDTLAYSFSRNNLVLQPIAGTELYRYEQTGNTLSAPTLQSSSTTSRTYRLPESSNNGDFRGSYGHLKVLYQDFRVVTGNAAAAINKSSVPNSGSIVERNDVIDYRVTVENTGNLAIPNAVITDVLDGNISFVSGNNSNAYTLSHSNGTVTAQLRDDLQPGASVSIDFQVRVNNNAPNNYVIRNQATVSGTNISATPSNEIIHTVQVGTQPGTVDITKTAHTAFGGAPISAPLQLGDSFVYRFTATNTTQNNLTETFTITDTLPNELSFLGFSSNNTIQGTESNGIVTFTLPGLDAGATTVLEIEVQIDSFPEDSTRNNTGDCTGVENGILNEVEVSGPFNRIDNDDVCIEVLPGAVDINKTAHTVFNGPEISAPLQIGDALVYRFTATNTTQNNLTETFTITDTLPNELSFLGFNPNNTIQGTVANDAIAFVLPGLNAGETVVLEVEVQIDNFPEDSARNNTGDCTGVENGILNEAEVTGNFARIDNDDVCIEVLPGVATITKTAHTVFGGLEISEPLRLGDNFVYRFTVENTTQNNLSDALVITDPLPNELSFLGFNPTNTLQGTENNGVITFTIPQLDAGTSIVLEIEVQIDSFPEDSTRNNTGDCTGIENGILNEAEVTQNFTRIDNDDVCIEVLQYTITKEAFNQQNTLIAQNTELQYGDTFEYRLTVSNDGNTPLTNLAVTDSLPNEVTLVQQISPTDGIYDTNNNTLLYNVNSVPAGATQSFQFEVQVRPESEISNASNVINNVTASANGLDPINDSTVHDLPGNGGGCVGPGCGGGSAPTIPTVGTCQVNPNGSHSCTKITPVSTSPGYQEVFIQCLKDNTGATSELSALQQASNDLKDSCVDLWATENGHTQCDPDETSANILATCERPLIPGGGSACAINPNASVKKYVWNDGAWDDEQTCVPQGTNTQYKADIVIPRVTEATVIDGASVSLQDYTIPYTSGWTWNRLGVTNARIETSIGTQHILDVENILYNGDPTGGMKLEHVFTPTERNALTAGSITVSFYYEVDTTLAVTSDICQLDNVAAARISFSGVSPSGNAIVRQWGAGNQSCDQIEAADIATFGDKARACIARPFIQARGGSNIGVNISTNINEDKVFGSDFEDELNGIDQTKLIPSLQNTNLNNGGSSSELLTNNQSVYGGTQLVNFDGIDTIVSDSDRERYFDQLKLNATNGINLPVAVNTGAKSQVDETYFVDGPVIIEGVHNIGDPTTIIIENGDLIIAQDFVNTGTGSIAFIVKNGNIIIANNVQQIDGIFLSENGSIVSDNISDVQLQVNGGLMGNARELLENRIYIGTNPTQQLEPAVIVRFDLRILENTPPGLDFFFGQNWTEQ